MVAPIFVVSFRVFVCLKRRLDATQKKFRKTRRKGAREMKP